MKICAYVQARYAKETYRNECMDTRQFVGLRVVIDCLERAGYQVDYAGAATVHRYDVVLVSLTSDCDWWNYIAERLTWQRGNYRVLVGGAGVLHVSPFLPFFYAAMLGRGENLIVPLVRSIEKGDRWLSPSVIYADTFSPDDRYTIAQVDVQYQHPIPLSKDRQFCEGAIGCNHKCLFCGYTWQRKFVSPYQYYRMEDSLFGNIADKERAMLDWAQDPDSVDFSKLRTTAIDGISQRLRVGVHKPITRALLRKFLGAMLASGAKSHQLKLYNIVGYPSECEDDYREFLEDVRQADSQAAAREKQWCLLLHNTPFRAMPATPMACAPMSLRNYRRYAHRLLAPQLKGNLLYQGRAIFAVESGYIESLSAVMLSAIAHRGSVSDAENVARVAASKKFWAASSPVKEKTLAKYFDVDRLFSAYTPETLPSRYLRTYARVERLWGRTPLEICAKGEIDHAPPP